MADSPPLRKPPAHPRSRGENGELVEGGVEVLGSSPLTRGKPHPADTLIWPSGLIPAHAGKTPPCRHADLAVWAHPRSRGENVICSIIYAAPPGSSPLTRGKRCGRCPPGSSPLTRGKPATPADGEFERRLIPAHAGKTDKCSQWSCWWPAHPRSRGENQVSSRLPLSFSGSSPLTRGKP